MNRSYLLAFAGLAFTGSAPQAATTLDTTFGSGGKVITSLPYPAAGKALAIQRDGKIVVAGSGGDNLLVLRYDGTGALDQGFAEDGVAVTNVGPPGSAQAVVHQADDRLLVAGGANGFVAARYDTDGTLVGTVRSTAAGGYSLGWGYGLLLQDDGTFIIAGDGYANSCAFARYTADGQLDQPAANVPDLKYQCRGLAPASNGSFVLSFNRETVTGAGGRYGFGLARFLADGSLDQTFGTQGVAIAYEGLYAQVNAVIRTADGDYLAAGGNRPRLQDHWSFLVGRFTDAGQPDPGFNGSGVNLKGLEGLDLAANAVAIDNFGNAIAGGVANGSGNIKDGAGPGVFALMRFKTDGKRDTSFGPKTTDGVLLEGFGTGTSAELSALAVQPDGKLIAAGSVTVDGVSRVALARYNLTAPEAGSPGTGGEPDCTSTQRVLQVLACGIADIEEIVRQGNVRKIRGKLIAHLQRSHKKFLAADRFLDDNYQLIKPENKRAFKRTAKAGLNAWLAFTKLAQSKAGHKYIPAETQTAIQSAVQSLKTEIESVFGSGGSGPKV